MTDDPYNNDLPLSADDNSDDEFAGLEAGDRRKSSSKGPLIALISLVVVAVAAFLTYQIFISPAGLDSGSDKPIAVAEPVNPVTPEPVPVVPADPAAVAPVAAVPVDPTIPPVAVPDPNAITAEAMAPLTADPVAPVETPVVDPAVAVVDPAVAPVIEPVPSATPPVSEVVATTPVAPTPVESAPVVAPVADTMPVPPAPPIDQLQPIDPNAVLAKAENTALPAGSPQSPSPQKVADTMNAVNDILGADAAIPASGAVVDAAIAKQVEVTPRAQQVIFVKKNYNANSPQAVVAAGDRVMDAGQYGDAVGIYDRELKKNPSNPLALAGKAMAQQKAGDNTGAMDTYQRLLDLNPRDLEALTNYLGLLQKENPSLALSRLQALSVQYPESAAVAGQLASTQAGMMDTPSALRSFQKAMSLDPSNPIYPFNIGVLYDRLGTSDKARESYRNALSLTREYPDRASGVPIEIIRNRLGSLSD